MSDIINVDVTEIVEEIVVEISEARDAYQLAVAAGFVGTLMEWLASLTGADGKTPYELALENGFVGAVEDWLASLTGLPGSDANVTNANVNAAIEGNPSASRGAMGLGSSALSNQAVGMGNSVKFASTVVAHDGSGGNGLFFERLSGNNWRLNTVGVGPAFQLQGNDFKITQDLTIERFGIRLARDGNAACLQVIAPGVVSINTVLTSPAGAAGSMQLANLTASGTVTATGGVKLGASTIGTLPTASTNAYLALCVTDALTPTRGSTVAAGGSAKATVRSNGTNWIVTETL